MRSTIVTRVRDRNPIEVADNLGHNVNGSYLGVADKSEAIGKDSFGEGTQCRSTPGAKNRTTGMDYRDHTDYDHC